MYRRPCRGWAGANAGPGCLRCGLVTWTSCPWPGRPPTSAAHETLHPTNRSHRCALKYHSFATRLGAKRGSITASHAYGGTLKSAWTAAGSQKERGKDSGGSQRSAPLRAVPRASLHGHGHAVPGVAVDAAQVPDGRRALGLQRGVSHGEGRAAQQSAQPTQQRVHSSMAGRCRAWMHLVSAAAALSACRAAPGRLAA